jgi:3'-phosphoadenosine 5'-phosphosulfate sulfotransferase (PAPS reductase)/FAD synthetase
VALPNRTNSEVFFQPRTDQPRTMSKQRNAAATSFHLLVDSSIDIARVALDESQRAREMVVAQTSLTSNAAGGTSSVAALSSSRLAVAFNGGKDSVVAVRLLEIALQNEMSEGRTFADGNRRVTSGDASHSEAAASGQHGIASPPSPNNDSKLATAPSCRAATDVLLQQRCLFFTFDDPDEFPELVEFRDKFCADRGVRLHKLCGKSLQSELWRLYHDFGVRHALLGTRRSDGPNQSAPIDASTAGWAPITRYAPAFEWTTPDVWQFIRSEGVPYCGLYDDGYSSLGLKSRTERDEKLRRADGTYDAAWQNPQLVDRSSRM